MAPPAPVLIASHSELAAAVRAVLPEVRGPRREAVLNLALQRPNTLLHDGRAWGRYTPRHIVASTRSALAEAPPRALFVHASFAFLHAIDSGAAAGDRLQPLAEAALEAEQLVLTDARDTVVVRLGYLYGPELRDLRAYRRAFLIGRPYWAGPAAARHHMLHTHDAARALLQVAVQRPRTRTVYASDGVPVSFGKFMDAFARRCGNPLPLHLPSWSRLTSHLVVKEEHMQQTELGVPGPARPQVPEWQPLYADYRRGIEATIAAWRR